MKRKRVMRIVLIRGGVKTSDGEVIETSGVDCVRLLLSGLPDDSELLEDKMLNLKDTFDRLTENFIKYNTKKDIMAFIRHQTVLKLMGAIMR